MSEKPPEKPATTLPGTVQKIIHSPDPRVPEKAEISLEGAEELYKEIRIENTLTDEKGNEVKLKQGADVEVTVEADPDAVVPKSGTIADGPSKNAPGKSPSDKPENHKSKGAGKR